MPFIWIAFVVAALLIAPARLLAQEQAQATTAPEVPRTLREAAPIDLTGYWVAQGSEDWRYRWLVPEAGDNPGVPVSAKGRQVADLWDPAADEAAGLACKGYGAAGLMRLPTRLHITWQDDNTLRVDTDAGRQTRSFGFGKPVPPVSERSWQGHSAAVWQTSGPLMVPKGARRPERTAGQLKVVTTHLRDGYLRKNGVPYSANALLTEYFTRAVSPTGDEWLVVTSIVNDPAYLNEPFITSSHFKREPDRSKWSPTECNAREAR